MNESADGSEDGVVAGAPAVVLQRRLAGHGTSFELLTEAVRQEVVDHYLRQVKLPLTQLAALAGYSEQSALSRSCRRWFGTTPSAYRRTGPTAQG